MENKFIYKKNKATLCISCDEGLINFLTLRALSEDTSKSELLRQFIKKNLDLELKSKYIQKLTNRYYEDFINTPDLNFSNYSKLLETWLMGKKISIADRQLLLSKLKEKHEKEINLR